MKKVISIMVVLCVAAALFATGTVKVGGAFDFVSGKTSNSEDEAFGSKSLYSGKGFGFDVSARYDVADGLTSWADFNMTFGSNAKFKADGANEWATLDDIAKQVEAMVGNAATAKKSVMNMSGAAGVAIKLRAADDVEVAVGGGIFAERMTAKVSAAVPSNINSTFHDVAYTYRFVNFGVTGYADVAYKFTSNFGVGLTVMPRVGLLNFTTSSFAEDTTVETYKAKGFALSFSMPISLGVSYAF